MNIYNLLAYLIPFFVRCICENSVRIPVAVAHFKTVVMFVVTKDGMPSRLHFVGDEIFSR